MGNPQEIPSTKKVYTYPFCLLYIPSFQIKSNIYQVNMKFLSLIISDLYKTLENISIIFKSPIAYEREMNLLYIIKQRQTNNT
jgi:hypothetical protein